MSATLHDAAHRVLGTGARLRDIQSDALDGLTEHDTLLVARSGAGKTAVYAIATLMTGRLTVVVSPLLALQRDQVNALREAGLRADSVSSARTGSQSGAALRAAGDGLLDVLLLAPEQLVRAQVQDALVGADVGLVVVDEAHCVSEWGHDFRPDYLAVAGVVHRLGDPRLLALTATASPRVRTEIVERLGMTAPRVLVHDADRPNIWLGVRHAATSDARDELVVRTALDEEGPTLVYARTHRHTEALARALTDAGRPTEAYHAGRPAAERTRVQDDFLAGRTDLLVATSAFGMGVDRADIRLVVHAGLPPSLDSYYQEVGRAGRDDQPARAVGAVLPGDVGLNRFLSSPGGPRPASVRAVLGAVTQGATTRHEVVAATGLTARTTSRALAALLDVGALDSHERGYRPGTIDEPTALRAIRDRRERQRAVDRSRVAMVQTYADSSDCRRRLLLELLGEQHPHRCGACDSCDAGTSVDVLDGRLTGGQPVVHEHWGPGTVSAVEADRVTVLFEERGYVTLDTEVALDFGLLTPR
ncbi:RecQ family ATP-dependent DNA helicase [uncultured Cellulomonas sp.]|uniref:RecQ family ATP-dependent DNA helicase n=1 Tax=uncultured Cellulomonas sp. TaxID=189682 RepID=UPI0028E5B1B6|nr:RecQ family ATP-dependent DNA helicase [uncultured Cellulomonas sp.]